MTNAESVNDSSILRLSLAISTLTHTDATFQSCHLTSTNIYILKDPIIIIIECNKEIKLLMQWISNI